MCLANLGGFNLANFSNKITIIQELTHLFFAKVAKSLQSMAGGSQTKTEPDT